MATPAGTGLRERKKARTRETIVECAFGLFRERGFESTTVADIAAAADIAPRTFFGYFATKEDVVFHDFEETLESLRVRLAEREEGEAALDAMRSWFAELLDGIDFSDEAEVCRQELIRSSPALQTRDRSLLAHLEGALADAVAADLGLPADSLRPRMVGAACSAVMTTLESFYHGDEPAVTHDPEDAMAILDEALVFLRGGIDALAAKSEAPPPRKRVKRPTRR
jgi:AcrR family transcriptional regulator